MTVYAAGGIRAAGKVALYAVPTVANLQAPTLTELTAATAATIHCDIFAWNPNPTQEKETERMYCSPQVIQTFGDVTWAPDDLVVLYDPQEPDSTNYKAYKSLLEDTSWVFVDRRAIDYTTALAVDQVVDLYPVKIGFVSKVAVTGESGEKFRATVPLIITGAPAMDVTIVAGS